LIVAVPARDIDLETFGIGGYVDCVVVLLSDEVSPAELRRIRTERDPLFDRLSEWITVGKGIVPAGVEDDEIIPVFAHDRRASTVFRFPVSIVQSLGR
jgi:hypothetical protein